MVKKIVAGCLALFIMVTEATGMISEAAHTQTQVVEQKIKTAEIIRRPKGEKKVTIPVPLEGIVDSTGNYEYIILDDGTVQIIKHLKKEETEVTIPSVLDGYTVTSIGKKAFYEERSVTDIEIPKTVTYIGEQAFESTGITSLNFPESVEQIGVRAFCDCDSLTELVIPDTVTILERGAFADCKSLKSVVIGKGVSVIENQTFMVCENLSEIVINGDLKMIGEEAFRDCHSLTRIKIPDGVTEIGNLAFYDCWLLKNVTVPKSVTEIGNKVIGFADDCDEKIQGVYITGYKDTAAYDYAKSASIAFRDIETGEDIRYDLRSVPKEKIKILVAGKGKIKLAYKALEQASYRIAFKGAGASSWEKYYTLNPSATIKGLKPGKQYKVKVRAVREIEGEQYYGEWSKVKKVAAR